MLQENVTPQLRPRIGGRAKKERVPSLRSIKIPKQKRNFRYSRAAHVASPVAGSRRVIVKARIVKMNLHGRVAAAMHVKYLERSGVDENGDKGKMYGQAEDFDRDVFIRNIEDEQHQFRFIISPEDGSKIDLNQFTRDLMKSVEKDLQRPLEWAAVNHYNTDNPHVHVIVRGVDRNGKVVTINPEYISHGLRYRAQEIVTHELGIRSHVERRADMLKALPLERWTELDSTIRKIAGNDLSIDLSGYQGMNRTLLATRLDKLADCGVADKLGSQEWKMRPEWEKTLREYGKRSDILRTIHKAANGDQQKYRINDIPKTGIMGKVIGKGLSNELYDKLYVIIQEPNGGTHYLDLDTKADPEKYRIGDYVSVKSERDSWLKKADFVISEQARRHGGIYNASQHLVDIGSSVVRLKDGRIVDAKDFVDAHEKRLFSLQKNRLATMLNDGNWQVDSLLVQKLSHKDQTEGPRERLVIKSESRQTLEEQICYRGRTWLDRYTDGKSAGSFANYGIGYEMKGAVQRRMQMLQEMGIDPRDPARGRMLDKIQTGDIANRIQNGGVRYSEHKQGGSISGTMKELPDMPNGKKYAQITDPRSKEFTLVPWQKDFDKLIGKQIELTSQGGRLLARLKHDLGR